MSLVWWLLFLTHSLFENGRFLFPDVFVAGVEILVLWVVLFPLRLLLLFAAALVVRRRRCGAGRPVGKQVPVPQGFSSFGGSKRGAEGCCSSQPQDASRKVTFQGRFSVVLNIFSE